MENVPKVEGTSSGTSALSAGLDGLEQRVRQFETLSLPGQSPMMHMGTAYLVSDLWREVRQLRALHSELVMAVARKYPGESRHETALRYIREREEPKGCTAAASNVELTGAKRPGLLKG